MLEPQERSLLLDALRPPDGFELDQAIGTTFTLDLVALLTTPLAFTLFQLEAEDGGPTPDPIAMLKAVRDHADRITIFCQAGQIAVPPHDQRLYQSLEESVHMVAPKQRYALFHPKVWVLRYVATGEQPSYRLLVLSRNLTFDRSWDIVLRLDGELTRRRRAFAANHPLGDFMGALPALALRSLPAARRAAVERIADEVRRVSFDLPDGVDSLAFWPLGLERYRAWPLPPDARRTLVISPFLGGGALSRIAQTGSDHVLVSREESIDRLDDQRDSLTHFETHVLDEGADPDASDEDEGPTTESKEAVGLRGLHAKAYVSDRGWDASLLVGSANATGAAFGSNVEFMVELRGKRSALGVDAVLDSPAKGVPGLSDLLMPYEPAAEPDALDEQAHALEREADELRTWLAKQQLVGLVEGPAGDGTFSLELAAGGKKGFKLPGHVKLTAWPATQNEALSAKPIHTRKPGSAPLSRFDGLEEASLTGFLAFRIKLERGKSSYEDAFVLNLPLRGAPKGRQEALLKSLLQDRGRVLRYLLFILAEAGETSLVDPRDLVGTYQVGGDGGAAATGLQLPLLESLVRAAAKDPSRLEQVNRLVEDLGGVEQCSDLLPPGFESVWGAIWEASKRPRR